MADKTDFLTTQKERIYKYGLVLVVGILLLVLITGQKIVLGDTFMYGIIGLGIVYAVSQFAGKTWDLYDMKNHLRSRVWEQEHGNIIDVSDENLRADEILPNKWAVYLRNSGMTYYVDAKRKFIMGKEAISLQQAQRLVAESEIIRNLVSQKQAEEIVGQRLGQMGFATKEE